MRKPLSLMLVAVLLAATLLVQAQDSGEAERGWGPTGQGVLYHRNAAYGYALNWYDGRNPHFNDFTGSGGDCANFVSQCLIAGGISLWQGTDGQGYGVYPDIDRPTTYSNGTIPYCDYLHQHLVGYQVVDYEYVVEGVNASIPANIDIGDVVIFGDGADHWRHAMMVVSVGAGDIGLAGHTTDTWDASFWGVLGGSFTCANFYHIRVEMSQTFPFIVRTGALNVRAGPGLNGAGNYYQDLGDAHLGEMYVAIGTQDVSGSVWYNFWFDERNLWCAADMASGNVYAVPVNQAQFEIDVNTALNVREGPGTGYAIAGQAFDGTRYVTKGMRLNGATYWRSFWWGGAVRWCAAGYTFNATEIEKDLTRLNVGFYPSWMGSSFNDLRHDLLSHLAWFSVEMDSAGDITAYNSWPSGWSDLVMRSKENGTKVLLTVTLFGSSSVSSFLVSPSARANGIANLLTLTIDGNADGIMIDFEYPPSGSDDNLFAFMQELHTAFKAEDLLYEVHFCLMPYPWASYGFDRLGDINDYCDYYFLMGYDYFYSGSSTTGACGALFWENNIDAWHAIDRWINVYGADRQKLVYGIPYFGFDWPVLASEYDQRGATTTGSGTAMTYSSAMSKLASTGAVLQWDAYSQSPWYWYYESSEYHQVWFDNATSLKFKYQVVNELDLPGMGIWALAYDGSHTELWDAIDEKVGPFQLNTAPTNESVVSGLVNISMNVLGGVTDIWVLEPGAGGWVEAVYDTDIHSSYEADYHHLWDTTALADGWHTVGFRLNNSYGFVIFENRSYYVQNGNGTFDIDLSQGWNLVSLPLEQENESLDAVLGSISGKWDYVQIYDPLSAEPWLTNCTYKPLQLNRLDSLNHTVGFWVHVTEPVTLTVSGSVPTSTSVPLFVGWNLVGYPSLTERSITDALMGTGYDRPVEGFNSSAPYRIGQLADSYLMKPGEGYWVHVPADIVWIIDW